jgi:hypothetical protein
VAGQPPATYVTEAARPLPVTTTTTSVSTTVSTPQGSGHEMEGVVNADKGPPAPADETWLHGFRIGYGYVMNFDKPTASLDGRSLADKTGMRTPHEFLLGYELLYRATGHSWLNVILVGNITVGGLEQSKFFPTANGLIGFEINNSFQLGVGPSLTPLKGEEGHVIIAGGWTPRAGSFYVPVHGFFIPDVDGVNRMGMTTGVTW